MAPTLDGWLAILAVVLAIATSYTTLELVIRLSAASRRRVLCRSALGALALGVALWCLTLVGLLSGAQGPADINLPVLFAALGLAVLGEAAMLAVLAGRAPSSARLLAGGAAATAGICATYWTVLAALGSLPSPGAIVQTLLLSLALGLIVCTAALWLRYRWGEERSALRHGARTAAVLMSTSALLGLHVMNLRQAPLLFPSFAPGPQATVQLFGLALAAIALAVLAVTQVIIVYDRRLAVRTGQCARELEEVHTRLQYLATHDCLTGLPNWLLFRERVAHAVADNERPGRAIAVAVIDLDHFSSLNHSLGHGAGDWLLAEVARRVGSVIGPEHLLARLGSDEFVVLIDSFAARVDAGHVTREILAALDAAISINGQDVHVRPSIGVSVWPDDGRRVDDLLAHAEVAMAVAKKHGGKAEFFQRGMTDSMQERLALENDLRRALAAQEFELSYQPVLSVKSGLIVAAEALLRWRHPLRGVIGPSSFIPLAEETGLMIPLGEWVVREACRQAAAWRVESGAPIRFAVNLSATQFRHQNLVDVIRSALLEQNLDPRCLEIELTESSVMTNPEESVGVLKQLRKMGVTIAVDDFGTGYSSLSYLRRFPIDKLKIDRSFVRDLATSRTDESIVRAIISLAHSVGLQVVAEGVESEEQLHFVRLLGCDEWQGYYCCEPQPASVFGAMLAEQSGTRTSIVRALTRVTRGG